MAAPTGYPSWAYNSAGQPALIVTSLTQFSALPGPGTWSATPTGTTTPPSIPYDTITNGTGSLQVTDIRAQQQLIEQRITNILLTQMAGNVIDDLVTVIRPDVLANDASLTS